MDLSKHGGQSLAANFGRNWATQFDRGRWRGRSRHFASQRHDVARSHGCGGAVQRFGAHGQRRRVVDQFARRCHRNLASLGRYFEICQSLGHISALAIFWRRCGCNGLALAQCAWLCHGRAAHQSIVLFGHPQCAQANQGSHSVARHSGSTSHD